MEVCTLPTPTWLIHDWVLGFTVPVIRAVKVALGSVDIYVRRVRNLPISTQA